MVNSFVYRVSIIAKCRRKPTRLPLRVLPLKIVAELAESFGWLLNSLYVANRSWLNDLVGRRKKLRKGTSNDVRFI